MPDLAQLNLVVDSSQVTVANNQMNLMVGVSGKAEVAIKGLGDQTQKTGEATKQATGSMGEMLKMVIALTGAYGALQSIRVALETAATEDRLLKGFTNITQSAKQAQDILNQLENFSKSSQFEFTGLADAAREFMALGQTGEQSIKIVQTIGKELETIGSGATDIDAVANSFKRMLETGQANLFLFRSLAGQGIPAVQMLAKALGTDVNGAMDLLRKNAISGADAVKVLTAGMQENVRNAKDTHETYTQLWQMLKNNLVLALGDTAKAFLDSINGAQFIKSLLPIIQGLSSNIPLIVGLLKDVATIVALLIALQIAAWLSSIVTAGANVTTMLIEMLANLIPLLTILAAITAFEFSRWALDQFSGVRKVADTTASYLIAVWDTIEFTWKHGADEIRASWNSVVLFVDRIIDQTIQKIKNLAALANMALPGNPLTGALNNAANSDTMNNLQAGAQADLASRGQDQVQTVFRLIGAYGDLKNELTSVYEGWKNEMKDVDKEFDKSNQKNRSFVDFVKGDFKSAMDTIASVVGAAGGPLSKLFPNLNLKAIADKLAASGLASQIPNTPTTPGGDVTIQPQLTEQLQRQLDKEISKLQDEANVVGMITDQRDKQLKILQMMDVLKEHGINPNRSDAQQFLNELDQAISRLQRLKEIQEIGKGIGDAFAKSFGEFITGAKNAQQAAKDFGNALEQVLLKKLVLDKVANLIEAGIGGIGKAFNPAGAPSNTIDVFGSNSSMPIQSSVLDVSPNAMGGAYWRGVKQFGSGDVFNRPTMFNIGMMGEAGPEAIMPLARRSDGKLGVAGGGGSTIHQYNFNISTPDADSFRRSTRQIAATAKRAFS